MKRTITTYGNPVLRARAKEIGQIDDSLIRLIGDMFETIDDPTQVGLAAPQVGVSSRAIVVDLPDRSTSRIALVNPRVLARESSDSADEGCLSVPGITGGVERARWVRISGLTVAGEEVAFEAEGFLARVLQHEIDHLNGVLFVDRVAPTKRERIRTLLERLAKEGGWGR